MFSRKSMRINADQRLFVDEERRLQKPVNDNQDEVRQDEVGALSSSAIVGQSMHYAMPMDLLERGVEKVPVNAKIVSEVWHQDPTFIVKLFLGAIVLNALLYGTFSQVMGEKHERLQMTLEMPQNEYGEWNDAQEIITYRALDESDSIEGAPVSPAFQKPSAPKKGALHFPSINE